MFRFIMNSEYKLVEHITFKFLLLRLFFLNVFLRQIY